MSVERYRDYLTLERGLEPETVANYMQVVTLFLTVQAGRGLPEPHHHRMSTARVSLIVRTPHIHQHLIGHVMRNPHKVSTPGL